jgi:hypothetical protein
MMDINMNGTVDRGDMKIFLLQLGIQKNIHLLWDNLRIDHNGVLEYNDIHRLLIPRAECYARIISSRQMQNRRVGEALFLQPNTSKLLSQYLSYTIESQLQIN